MRSGEFKSFLLFKNGIIFNIFSHHSERFYLLPILPPSRSLSLSSSSGHHLCRQGHPSLRKNLNEDSDEKQERCGLREVGLVLMMKADQEASFAWRSDVCRWVCLWCHDWIPTRVTPAKCRLYLPFAEDIVAGCVQLCRTDPRDCTHAVIWNIGVKTSKMLTPVFSNIQEQNDSNRFGQEWQARVGGRNRRQKRIVRRVESG